MNSAEFLDECLSSIEEQTYPKIETIVVDKRSTDDTLNIAESHGARILTLDAWERAEQMNLGAEAARGEYMYIVGSDFRLEPEIVEEAVEILQEGYGAVVTHNTSDPSVSYWSRVRKFERDMYKGDELNVGARFLRTADFLRLGGYDEKLVAGEDYDFHNRMLREGFEIGSTDAVEIHLGEPRTLREVAKKNFYYGRTFPGFLAKNPDRGWRQLSPIRPAFIRNYREFLRHPVLALSFLVYQTVKYSSASAGFVMELAAKTIREWSRLS